MGGVALVGDKDVFKLIHTIQKFSNHAIIQWTKSTQNRIGISPILVLVELRTHGPQMQFDIALTLGFTPGAVTNIANKLIELQLAKREYDSSDRRKIYLVITEEGIEVLKEAQLKGQLFYEELFQVLSEEELHQFLSIYEKLLRSID